MRDLFHATRKVAKRILQFAKRVTWEAYVAVSYHRHRNAFVFGAPYHSNAGDQAQTYCIERWLRENYPGFKTRMFDTSQLTQGGYRLLHCIRGHIGRCDLIFLHSGYHTTDLYMFEEEMQRQVVSMFPDYRIVMLPQTVNYTDPEERKRASAVYNSHSDLLMLCRDKVSLRLAEDAFPRCRKVLFPDIVTTMIGTRRYTDERTGILLCVRADKESDLGEVELRELIHELERVDRVDRTDTTLPISGPKFAARREAVLEGEWERYSRYRAVVTDRYHGTIFSLVAGTPVVVLGTTDHKLESGVAWFPDSFAEYVYFAHDTEEVLEGVRTIYTSEYDHVLPNYFQTEYYDKLRSIIEGVDDDAM